MLRRGYGIALLVCIFGFLDYKAVLANRLALVGAPENVGQATATALGAWHIEIVELPGDPALDDASCAERARAVAARHGADVVVWLTRSARGHELNLYDRAHDQLVTRSMAMGPPFSEPDAASLALSIKTMLRHREPTEITYSCGDAAKAGVSPVDVPPVLQIAMTGGVMMDAVRAETWEPRLTLAALWAPPGARSVYTFVTSFSMGPGIAVDKNGFVGDFTDIAFRIGVHRRYLNLRYLEAEGVVGVGLHRPRMDGLIVEGAQRVSVARVSAGLDTGVALSVPLFLGVRGRVEIKGSYFPVRQIYVLYGEHIFSAPRFAAQVGIGLSVPFL